MRVPRTAVFVKGFVFGSVNIVVQEFVTASLGSFVRIPMTVMMKFLYAHTGTYGPSTRTKFCVMGISPNVFAQS